MSRIMTIAVDAWRLRETARQALASGEFDRAVALSVEAQKSQATPAGEALRQLSEWLWVRSMVV